MNSICFDKVGKKYVLGERGYGMLRDHIADTCRLFVSRQKDRASKRAFWALKDVCFELKHGRALGIIGPNGAGKSTILKLLAKVIKPTVGKVSIVGRVAPLIELGAGFHPELTGRENVYLNGSILGMTRAEVNRKFDSIVAFADLQDFIDTPVKRYSSGMYARLGFAVAAHVEPEVLLIDEVLSVGDINFQQKCLKKMNDFRKRGCTIVFVSHNVDAILNLCPRTILLKKGQIVFDGDTGQAINRYHKIIAGEMMGKMQSDEEDNNGKQRVNIVSFQLTNSMNESVSMFKNKDKAVLKVEYCFTAPVANTSFGFFVRRDDRLLIVDTSSVDLGSVVERCGAGNRATVKFEFDVNLLTGIYYIGTYVRDNVSGEYYCYMDRLVDFLVNDDYAFQGVADLKPKSEVRISEEYLE